MRGMLDTEAHVGLARFIPPENQVTSGTSGYYDIRLTNSGTNDVAMMPASPLLTAIDLLFDVVAVVEFGDSPTTAHCEYPLMAPKHRHNTTINVDAPQTDSFIEIPDFHRRSIACSEKKLMLWIETAGGDGGKLKLAMLNSCVRSCD